VSLNLDSVQTLGIAIAVLFLGNFAVARTGFLRNNDIPIPVVGGILFALATTFLYLGADVGLSLDVEMRTPLMLAFFTTIGLGADLRMLAHGGPRLIVFAGLCFLYLVLQNGIGMIVALGLDLHPAVGLLGSSITLSGGHGTGAAYAARFADSTNLAGAMELAMACATFGLIVGGLIGGPVAGRLIRRHGLTPDSERDHREEGALGEEVEKPIDGDSLLHTLFIVVVCVVAGQAVASLFAGAPFTLPSFVWCLFFGVIVRNTGGALPVLRTHAPTVDTLGGLSLSLFLAMALMSLQLWELMGLAGPLLVLIAVQALGMAAFASLVTWRFMGRHYDAAIIAGGHCGFGMGATPTAVANMQALTKRFGHSPEAFLVVPLTGAFLIDLMNAIVIQGYLALPVFGQ